MMDFILEMNRWAWLGVYLGMCVVASLLVGQFIKAGKGPYNRRYDD